MAGNGFIGSATILTSVANQEIIPDPDPSLNWTQGYKLAKVTLLNYSDCTVKINNGLPIFLKSYQGFNTDGTDALITSLKIVENGILYSFMGSY